MDDGDMDMDMEGGMGEETTSRQASARSRTMSRQSNRPGELHRIDIRQGSFWVQSLEAQTPN